ncbi:hypothetical protein VA599_23725 [Chromobacterium sp. TRC.1.1.SA]|uniref:Uncharacterized protein n=1 Tax=Chromobacterium indicum TaxID=3110228 RepID=A0ABV0CRG6_9NEIS
MKALLAGFTHSKGIAKESQRPFDILSAIVLNPAGNVAKENFSKQGFGYEAVEIPVAASAKSAFMALTYPCRVELAIDHEMFAGKLKAVISGLEHPVNLVEQQAKGSA